MLYVELMYRIPFFQKLCHISILFTLIKCPMVEINWCNTISIVTMNLMSFAKFKWATCRAASTYNTPIINWKPFGKARSVNFNCTFNYDKLCPFPLTSCPPRSENSLSKLKPKNVMLTFQPSKLPLPTSQQHTVIVVVMQINHYD